MEYEIVELTEKYVAGVRVRTNNLAPDMGQKIGGAWSEFYSSVYDSLPNKVNGKSIGLYTNYAGDFKNDYDCVICSEIKPGTNVSKDLYTTVIPAGKYAKFIVKGDPTKDVGTFWTKLWEMDLNRTYTCDFEEYQLDGTKNNCEVHIYIAIN
ncbi:MAG: GyrI-like domain-containing protein [Clostridiaceae bacterium]|nr:GyrI-like domain-containing protein [Clostridiaceae bacterium]